MTLLLLLAACGGGDDDDSATARADSADSGDDAIDTATLAELYGAAPAEPVPVPTFTATNLDGAARTQADLLEHRTVMWFYPAASTAG